jgi:hypothetical protein
MKLNIETAATFKCICRKRLVIKEIFPHATMLGCPRCDYYVGGSGVVGVIAKDRIKSRSGSFVQFGCRISSSAGFSV